MVSIQTVHIRAAVSQERSEPLHRLVSFLCVLTQERRAPEGSEATEAAFDERWHLEQKR